MYKLFPCLATATGILLLKNIRRKNACHATDYSTLQPVDDVDDFKWNCNWRQGIPNGKVHHVILIAKPDETTKDLEKVNLAKEFLTKVIEYFKDRDKWTLDLYSCNTNDRRLLSIFEPSEGFVVEQGIVKYREALNISYPYNFSPYTLNEFGESRISDDNSFEDDPASESDTNAANRFIDELFTINEKNRLSIVIAHKNLIKYLLFKTLQLPLDAHRRIKLNDFTVTWLTVDKEGKPFCSLMNR